MPPKTLFAYLVRRLAVAVVVLAAGLASLVTFVELNETLRYVAKVRQGGFGFAALVSLMRAPSTLMWLAPFIFLCGAIWAFYQLNRRAELAVMRASGLSVWRIIGPAALLAAVSGLALILVVDPVASHLLASSERMKLDLRGRTASMVEFFGDGIWLRQRDGDDVLIINARQFDPAAAKIADVTLLRIDKSQRFVAAHGLLSGRTIELYEARIRAVGQSVDMRTPVYAVTSTLSPKDLQQNIGKPESLSIWKLPQFIVLAESSGLPTLRYSIRFHDLCSTPLKLIA
ncbi:MAG: LptF/LptG family permease, partial [Parvularculaceae bacterium]|nr:LptF/LptG family permease [Parvularculaceae bacterium]